MIKGIGTDIVSIQRVQRVLDRFQDRFVDRMLHEDEKQLFRRRNCATRFLAGRFAAKEAIVKAIGSGLRGFAWSDINIKAGPDGEPQVVIENSCKKICRQRAIADIKVSISHEKQWATAVAIALADGA